MRKIVCIFFLVCSYKGLYAQTLKDAIVKTDNENFDAAARDFRELLKREPNKGENYFYYGENFFKRGDADSAEYFYTKGMELNATQALCYVGMGKIFLGKNIVPEAKAQFFKAVTLSANKNAEVFRKMAEAWLSTTMKDADEAMKNVALAIKLEPKNSENYIVMGDAEYEKNPAEGGIAIKSYHKATELNPMSARGILREGKIYQRGRNYNLAVELYNKALGIEPNFAPAYREIAELYFMVQQPAKSITNWKKYLELNNSDYARYRFMSALFSNKQYADAVSEYENLKKSNYQRPVMERLAGYSYEEAGDKTDKEAYSKGLVAISRFFEKPENNKFLATDYKYRGLLLMHNGKDSMGMVDIDKAIEMDAALATELYGKVAKMYVDAKNYDKVIKFYEKKKNGDYKNLNITECFDLGRAYYNLASKESRLISAEKEELIRKKKEITPELMSRDAVNNIKLNNSDSSFKKVIQLNPNYIMGYIWRGRANSLIDPNAEKDSTKTYYEKALSMMKPEEKTNSYKNNVIEAYEYLGFYYVKHKNEEKAKETWNMVKELDPNNEKAKFYLNPPKPQPQQKPAGK